MEQTLQMKRKQGQTGVLTQEAGMGHCRAGDAPGASVGGNGLSGEAGIPPAGAGGTGPHPAPPSRPWMFQLPAGHTGPSILSVPPVWFCRDGPLECCVRSQ